VFVRECSGLNAKTPAALWPVFQVLLHKNRADPAGTEFNRAGRISSSS
jgi:hypothetical protein